MASRGNPARRSRKVWVALSRGEAAKKIEGFVQPSSLMKGFATVDEVAAMSTYLASELSSATDGAALRADGGVLSVTL